MNQTPTTSAISEAVYGQENLQSEQRMSSDRISPPPLKRRRLSSSKTEGPLIDTERKPQPESTSVSHNRSVIQDALSIYTWNINGITPFLQTSITSYFSSPARKVSASSDVHSSPDLRSCLQRWKWPQVVFLQEIKIAHTDTKTKLAVEAAVNKSVGSQETGPHYAVHFCLPRDRFNARGLAGSGKVYGVAAIIRQDFSIHHKARLREVDWDEEGRVIVIETTDSSEFGKLAMLGIYAVNGTMNPWRDSRTGGLMGTRHDKKRLFHRKLLEECLRLEKDGFGVILAGDMNIARDRRDGYPNLRLGTEHVKNRADFETKFFHGEDGMKAIDTFRELHGDERRFTYHPRGVEWGSSCDRVDLIMVSRSLKERLVVADILDSPQERGPSDHAPLCVVLSKTPNEK